MSAAVQTLDRGIRRCPGGTTKAGNLIGYFRSPEFRRLVVIAGKPPSAGQTRICWAMGVFDPDGSGSSSGPSSRCRSPPR